MLQEPVQLRGHLCMCVFRGLLRSPCRKENPTWFGANSCTSTHFHQANAGEKSHGHKFIVQTDHLHIQLGERRKRKIQLLHLRYPKLLCPPRLICRLKTTLTIEAIQYSVCVPSSCIICICNSLLEIQVGFFFRVCLLFLQVCNCAKFRYFLRKKCHKKEVWCHYFRNG